MDAKSGDRVEMLIRECEALKRRTRRLSVGLAIAIVLALWGVYGAHEAAATRGNRSPIFHEVGLSKDGSIVFIRYVPHDGLHVTDALGRPVGRINVETSPP